MKLNHKSIAKDRSGHVTIVAEDAEDMWGDLLRCSTVRRTVQESATGSTTKSTVRLTITIEISQIDFDVQNSSIRINGKNQTENPHIKMGGYHTLDLELSSPFTLTKLEWYVLIHSSQIRDSVSLDLIKEACNPQTKADLAAIVLEPGLAHILLLTSTQTLLLQKIERTVPKKGRGTTTQHDKGTIRFYEDVYRGLVTHIDFDRIKALVIASPGFVKVPPLTHCLHSQEAFFAYMNAEAVKTENRMLIEAKKKICLVKCASGHRHALSEVLSDPIVLDRVADTKYAVEVQTLKRFYKVLADDENKACYGFEHCQRALAAGAVDTLMVTDALFRSCDIATRRLYISFVERVKASGASVLIFSTLHTSGEQLANLTGIAAILHFPIDFDE